MGNIYSKKYIPQESTMKTTREEIYFNKQKLEYILSKYEDCKESKFYRIINKIIDGDYVNDPPYISLEHENMVLVFKLDLNDPYFSYGHKNYNSSMKNTYGHYYKRSDTLNFYEIIDHLFSNVVSKMISNDNLEILEEKVWKIGCFLCRKCFGRYYYNTTITYSPLKLKDDYSPYTYYSGFTQLEDMEKERLEILHNLLKDGNKILVLTKKTIEIDAYLWLIGIDDIDSCGEEVIDHTNHTPLYINCERCFNYYLKLLPLLQNIGNKNLSNSYVKCKRVYKNLFQTDLTGLRDFTEHICKKDRLMFLLDFIEDNLGQLTKSEIVNIVTGINRIKNANN